MEQPPLNFWQKLRRRLQDWRSRSRLQKIKRRAEYLYLNPRYFWRRVAVKLHPQSLWSFFTSKDGWWFLFKLGITGFVIFCLAVTGIYFYYRRAVPATIVSLQACLQGETIEFYDRTGQTLLWTNIQGDVCEPVQLEDVSRYFIDGLITIEDKDFYKHRGYKLVSIARSLVNNLLGRPLQGGSTITQQYIKNAVLKDSTRNYERKIKEIVLVPELESIYTKDQILTAYLNTTYFGSRYSGIEAAAQGFFDKPASDLTLDESALLVAAIQSPSVIWDQPELHMRKRNIVLREMLKDKKISPQEHDQALTVDTLSKLSGQAFEIEQKIVAPHFVFKAKEQLTDILCQTQAEEDCEILQRGGYQIITTLDLQLYEDTEKFLSQIFEDSVENYNNLGLVIIDSQKGQVLSSQGSIDYQNPDFGKVDQVTRPRPPQTLWQPLLYAAFLEGRPSNYSLATLEAALARSDPDSALGIARLTAKEQIEELALNLGVNHLRCLESCPRFQAEARNFQTQLDNLSNAYASFARQGKFQALGYILEVEDKTGRKLYSWQASKREVMEERTSQIISRSLSSYYSKPSGLRKYQGLAFESQIGEEQKDSQAIAYDIRLTVGLWLGQEEILESEQVLEMQELILDGLWSTF